MKRLVVLVAAILFATTSVFAEGKKISFDKLPGNAKKFIKEFFADKTIGSVLTEGRSIYQEYDVDFEDGPEVEFNSKGEWTKVDCEKSEVPKGIIPAKISDYVKKLFKGKTINEIEKLKGGAYKVELSNGVDLAFNKKFKMIKQELD